MTKQQGIVGEAQVLAKFIALGIPVSIPFGDNCSYDLVAEINGELKKVQVKASTQTADGKTVFELVRRRINTTTSYIKAYEENEVDYYALYAIALDKVYLVPFKDAPTKQLTMRYEPTKNNQQVQFTEEKYLIDNYSFE